MGLFSDPCENPDCNARVKKGAQFCSKCGYAGSNSLTTCPDCHKRVGRTSRFCWSCGADITESQPPRIVGERWVRDEEEFAVRVYPDDLERKALSKKVHVEAGTVGVIEKGGKIKKDIEWGTHTLDGILKLTGPTSIILVSAADAVLRPTFRGLKDANGADLELTLQLVLRVADYEPFVRKYFEGHKRRVTYSMLQESIAVELEEVMRGLVCTEALEKMFGNLKWRDELEDKLRAVMSVTLDRFGLELFQLNFVSFGGDHFEQLQRDQGEKYMGNHAADHLAEKVAIHQRVYELKAYHRLEKHRKERDLAVEIRELNNGARIRAVMSDAEREETIRQARHELDLKDRLREAENAELERELEKVQVDHQNEIAVTVLIGRNKREATEEEFRRERERLGNGHVRREAWDESEQRRHGEVADAKNRYAVIIEEAKLAQLEVEIGRERFEQEHYEATKLEELEERQRDHKTKTLLDIQKSQQEALRGMREVDLEEKKMDVDLKRFEKEKEAEVQLAGIDGNVKIVSSEERLKSAVSETRAAQLEERLAEQKSAVEQAREDADKRAQDVKDIAGVFAGVPRGAAGLGGVGAAQGAAASDVAPCPECNRPVPLNYPNCPWCQHKITR